MVDRNLGSYMLNVFPAQQTNGAKLTAPLGSRKEDMEVESLMREWFVLKKAAKAMRVEMSVDKAADFYCERLGRGESPVQCISQTVSGVELPEDACEPCKYRRQFILKRQENSTKRAQILGKVERILFRPSITVSK